MQKITIFIISLLLLATVVYGEDAITGASRSYKKIVKVTKSDSWGILKKKILVVYYTQGSNTKRVAQDIAMLLDADSELIIDKKKRGAFTAGAAATFNMSTEIETIKNKPEKYDIVIVGTPIWSWSMTPAVRTYLEMYKNRIKKVAFFTVAGGTGPDGIIEDMEELVNKKSIVYTGFNDKELADAGAVEYKKILYKFVQYFYQMDK